MLTEIGEMSLNTEHKLRGSWKSTFGIFQPYIHEMTSQV